MEQKFKIQVPDGCSAKIEQQDGFLVVVFEPKEWKPKDGDIIMFGGGTDMTAIFQSYSDDGTFSAHIVYSGKLIPFKPGWINRNMRPATDDEKQRLFDALAKEGKRWNAETKQIEDLPRWRAYEKGEYYGILPDTTVGKLTECRDDVDKIMYERGNYFKTREAAERAAEKIRKILKESEAE